MMDAFQTYWAGRTARERWMLIVAGVLALGVIGWLLLRPLAALGGDLRAEHQAAVEREGRVAAKIALLKAPAGARAAVSDGSLSQALAQSSGEMGLSLARNEVRGSGASIAISGAKAQTVMAWLASLEAQGLVIDTLNMTPQADGTVGLTADVRAVTP
jgi:general secretion pathway protein M